MNGEMESVTGWLFDLTRFGEKNGLENIRELLRRLGDPQDSFKSIHVAGSDGKGSTCALIHSVLKESGLRTGLFTSPHITRVNERISACGTEISDEEFIQLVHEVRDVIDGMRADGFACTFFEAITAIGFEYFRRKGVEYAVVEAGMGGRFDATNVLVPVVSVICNISLEHTRYLGSTIGEIAFEKAGIIKPGVPAVTCNKGEALEVMGRVAGERGSALVCTGDVETLSEDGCGSVVRYRGGEYRIGIPGAFQSMNSAMAMEALGLLDVDINPDRIRNGLASAEWPCRMQRIDGMNMIVDVTHTVAGMRALAEDVLRIYGKVVTVFGVLDDKDVHGMSRHVAEMSDHVIATRPGSPRALDADAVFESVSEFTDSCEQVDDIGEAIDLALSIAGDRTVLVTGSFAMAESALERIGAMLRVEADDRGHGRQPPDIRYVRGRFAGRWRY